MLQSFMDAREQEKTTDEYNMRVEISQRRTEQRGALKIAAHEARRKVTLGGQIDNAIQRGERRWMDLNDTELLLLDAFNSGKLHRIQKKCDQAFGWNRVMKSAAGNGAARLNLCDNASDNGAA